MAEIKLSAEKRTEFGKGAARRTRRAGLVPAVLYGRGSEPVHIALPAHDTMLALRQANALLSIDIKGEKAQLALPKQVQRDPVKGFIEHVDLILVKRGEKVVVEVGITLTGEAESDTIVMQDRTAIAVLADPTQIPSGFELSVEGLEVGAQLLASDLELPEGVELHDDAETLIASVAAAPTQAELDASLETAEGEEPAAGDEAAEDAEEAAEDAE